jgi:hypothetical protein
MTQLHGVSEFKDLETLNITNHHEEEQICLKLKYRFFRTGTSYI